MIDCPVTLILLAVAATGALRALSRRRNDKREERRAKELTAKLESAAREADEHIAAYVARERTRGGRHG